MDANVMNKSDVHVGAYVRAITGRWDAPAGPSRELRAWVMPVC